MPPVFSAEAVAAVRALDRLHHWLVGGLQSGPSPFPYSLSQVWVLSELSRHCGQELSELRHRLGIDAGYLSRILGSLEADGMLVRDRSALDPRRRIASLTPGGRVIAVTLDTRLAQALHCRLNGIAVDQRYQIIEAMTTIREVIEASAAEPRGERRAL